MFLLPMDNLMLGDGMSAFKIGRAPHEPVIAASCCVGMANSLLRLPLALQNVTQIAVNRLKALTTLKVYEDAFVGSACIMLQYWVVGIFKTRLPMSAL